jgi:hypothetical protein
MRFPHLEDGRCGCNKPRFEFLNTKRIVIYNSNSFGCGWLASLAGCTGFDLSSTFVNAPYVYTPSLGSKFLLFASVGEFSFDSSSSSKFDN